jgi:NAD(P)-dependent dehydrogenase (short-subunit alcohol dehydrogenase family)
MKEATQSELFDLAGKTAIVTGGGGGLGRAICRGFAEAGVRVAAADIALDLALETAGLIRDSGGSARADQLDVSSREDVLRVVREVLEAWGAIDVLVNCAGRAIRGAALDYPEQDFDAILNVNLKGTFLCCQAVGRHMAERRSGKIINISSIGGFIAYPGSIAYLASKGGVVQLTRGFAVELAPFNVQVNAIAPSLFETPMMAASRADPESQRYFTERTPMGRRGQPEEIVGAAIFLATKASSMVTGHVLAVDGGFLSA